MEIDIQNTLIPIDAFYIIIEHLNPETLRCVSKFIDTVVLCHYNSITSNPAALKFLRMINTLDYKMNDRNTAKLNQLVIKEKLPLEPIKIHFGPDVVTEIAVNKYIERYEKDILKLMVTMAQITVNNINIDNKKQTNFRYYKQDIFDRVCELICDDQYEIIFRDLEIYPSLKIMRELCNHIFCIYNMFFAMLGLSHRYWYNSSISGWVCDYCPHISYYVDPCQPCENCSVVSKTESTSRYRTIFDISEAYNAEDAAGDENICVNITDKRCYNWFMNV